MAGSETPIPANLLTADFRACRRRIKTIRSQIVRSSWAQVADKMSLAPATLDGYWQKPPKALNDFLRKLALAYAKLDNKPYDEALKQNAYIQAFTDEECFSQLLRSGGAFNRYTTSLTEEPATNQPQSVEIQVERRTGLGVEIITIVEEITEQQQFQHFLDKLYWHLGGIGQVVQEYTYGKQWLLLDGNGRPFNKAGQFDTRPLVEVGVKAGSKLKFVWLENDRKR
jgi:hypothetical protein